MMVGGTLYRAYDQGVFNTGQGPAYNAWRVWDAEAGGVPLALVRAAVLATNAHNTEPWLFHVSSDRIDLYAALDRNIGTIDSLRREMYISLGCALENLALAAVAHGFAPVIQLMPDPLDQTFVASIDLAPSQNAASPLYAAIPARHTDRATYAIQMVASETLAAMESLIELPSVSLVWFKSTEEKPFSDFTLRATEAIIADPAQAADDFAWYRTSWNEVQTRKDGITPDAAGIGKRSPGAWQAGSGLARTVGPGMAHRHPRDPAADRRGFRHPGCARLPQQRAAHPGRAHVAADALVGHDSGNSDAAAESGSRAC